MQCIRDSLHDRTKVISDAVRCERNIWIRRVGRRCGEVGQGRDVLEPSEGVTHDGSTCVSLCGA